MLHYSESDNFEPDGYLQFPLCHKVFLSNFFSCIQIVQNTKLEIQVSKQLENLGEPATENLLGGRMKSI